VAREINKLIQESNRKRFDIALSGGSTPKKLFRALVKKHHDTIPWERVHFWWGDERCVSPESEESNYRLAMKSAPEDTHSCKKHPPDTW
jgi:6-phosphogluconolactonase